jgi:hypothetical protein
LIIFYFTDLSFNNIREIQGLDKLKKLKDLSLAHNFIQEVDGLKSLKELQLLSLGHNELSNLQHTALYLRELCSLQSVCLRGNKFSPTPQHITSGSNSENAETFRQYQMYCIAIIPSLIYLDYQMILDDMRSIACDQHSEFIQEIEHKEKDEKLKLEAKKIYKEKEHQYTVSNVCCHCYHIIWLIVIFIYKHYTIYFNNDFLCLCPSQLTLEHIIPKQL